MTLNGDIKHSKNKEKNINDKITKQNKKNKNKTWVNMIHGPLVIPNTCTRTFSIMER